jgi:AcrR family transcriptional regulator
MTKRAEELDATRHQLVQATLEVAAEGGLDALTMQAVAKRADVAVRTVYNYFDSREALIAAAMDRLTTRTREVVERIEVPDGSPRERLRAFVLVYVASYEEQGATLPVVFGSLHVPQVREVVEEMRAWRRRELQRILRSAERAGVLSVSAREALTICYLATAYATYATLVSDLAVSPESARSTLVEMVDRAVFEAAS